LLLNSLKLSDVRCLEFYEEEIIKSDPEELALSKLEMRTLVLSIAREYALSPSFYLSRLSRNIARSLGRYLESVLLLYDARLLAAIPAMLPVVANGNRVLW
jgi:uncharacterized membrane protein